MRAAAPRRSEGMNGAGRGCGGEGRFGSRCGPASARRAARATSSTSATASSSPPPRPRCAAPPHARSDAALSLPLRRRDLCALVSWTSDYGACWNPRLCAVLGLNRPPRVRRMSCGTGRGGAGGGLRGRGQALPLRPRRLTRTQTRTRTRGSESASSSQRPKFAECGPVRPVGLPDTWSWSALDSHFLRS